MEQRWRADLVELAADRHEIDIQIDVEANTEGAPRKAMVDSEDADLAARAERLLTDHTRVWELFLDSPAVESLVD